MCLLECLVCESGIVLAELQVESDRHFRLVVIHIILFTFRKGLFQLHLLCQLCCRLLILENFLSAPIHHRYYRANDFFDTLEHVDHIDLLRLVDEDFQHDVVFKLIVSLWDFKPFAEWHGLIKK